MSDDEAVIGPGSRLARLGYSEFFANQAASANNPAFKPYRVATRARNRLLLYGADDAPMWADIRGRLFNSGQAPAIGDWVLASQRSDGDGLVEELLERRSHLTRQAAGRRTQSQVIAANLELVFVVASANNELNVRRLERYLTAVLDGGCRPLVVINKTDLGDIEEISETLTDVSEIADVLYTCALAGEVEPIRTLLTRGQTAAFVGSSGVGKSTLINALYGQPLQKTGAIREDGKGRHTTTARELIVTDDSGLLIDTPGMRELALWEGSEGLGQAFSDIEALAAKCRFRDCAHRQEPGCAVQEALTQGDLATKRYESYTKLGAEIAEQKERVRGSGPARAGKNIKKR